MKRYTEHERPPKACCYDCGLPYGVGGWLDCIISDSVWEQINPTYTPGAGLLCITCIARRCAELELEAVPVQITGGVLVPGFVTSVNPLVVSDK